MSHRISEALRRKFWLLPAIGLVLGVVVAYAMTEFDQVVDVDLGIFGFSDAPSARNALSTLATATLSVAGIAFTVTLVALQLASGQLSPRVLTTFREDRLTQVTLAAFLGLFAYALMLLGRLAEGDSLPELSLSLAMLGALGSLGLFVAFIGRTVAGLQASTVIRRIANDGRRALDTAHPHRFGTEPEDATAAQATVTERLRTQSAQALRAREAGYLVAIKAERLLPAAKRHDALVVQEANLGDYLVTGQAVARLHCAGPATAEAVDDLECAFVFSEERTMAGDVAFPVRSLTDVALRALSPGINDPTTSENAMGAVSDTIIGWLDRADAGSIRTGSSDGAPRFVASAPTLADLVALGFDQVIGEVVDTHPVVARRLIKWLAEIERQASERGLETDAVRERIERLEPTARQL